MIRAGVGWGNLPDHFIRDDLSARRLVAIRPAAWGEHEHRLTLSLVYRRDMTFGRAHRWLMAALQELCLDGDEATSRAATNATTPTGNSTS
jgi:DNA-binding transcriptional LysR family regulator